jgi:UDP-3-O-[3-hydroxymyristoyl] glucosamine N-acyltransferase
MQFTAKEICVLLNGELEGNPDETVFTLSKIEEGVRGSLSFLSNPKYEPYLYTTEASVVIVNKNLQPERQVNTTLIKVDDAYSAFSVLLERYNQIKLNKSGIEQPSFIHPSATMGDHCYVGAFAYIGANARIGKNVKIYPQVYIGDNVTIDDNSTLFSGSKIYSDCTIGKHVIIHSGAVIGSDGFGFAPQADGSYNKVAQIGNVIIEDHVEVGSNTSIDRATIGSTVIRKGVKLDNLIQIAHNVEVGNNTVIASQSGISGSTKVGEQCIIGGQVGIVGHISIARGSQINAKSGISKSITEENKQWNGLPVSPFRDSLKMQAVYRRLPELEKRIEELEQLLKDLKQTAS